MLANCSKCWVPLKKHLNKLNYFVLKLYCVLLTCSHGQNILHYRGKRVKETMEKSYKGHSEGGLSDGFWYYQTQQGEGKGYRDGQGKVCLESKPSQPAKNVVCHVCNTSLEENVIKHVTSVLWRDQIKNYAICQLCDQWFRSRAGKLGCAEKMRKYILIGQHSTCNMWSSWMEVQKICMEI